MHLQPVCIDSYSCTCLEFECLHSAAMISLANAHFVYLFPGIATATELFAYIDSDPVCKSSKKPHLHREDARARHVLVQPSEGKITLEYTHSSEAPSCSSCGFRTRSLARQNAFTASAHGPPSQCWTITRRRCVLLRWVRPDPVFRLPRLCLPLRLPGGG